MPMSAHKWAAGDTQLSAAACHLYLGVVAAAPPMAAEKGQQTLKGLDTALHGDTNVLDLGSLKMLSPLLPTWRCSWPRREVPAGAVTCRCCNMRSVCFASANNYP